MTDAIKLPSGTTAERPTPLDGMIRYNEDDNEFETSTFVLNRVVSSETTQIYEYGVSNMSASDGAGVASGSNSSTSMDITNDTSSNTDFRLIFTDTAESNRILK